MNLLVYQVELCKPADPSVYYYHSFHSAFFGLDYGLPFVMDRVQCTSSEAQLTQCNYTQYYDISPWWQIYITAIKCQTSKTSESNFIYYMSCFSRPVSQLMKETQSGQNSYLHTICTLTPCF